MPTRYSSARRALERNLNALAATRASLTRNVFANWANTIATVVYTLIITPTVVRALGTEKYGLWSFLNGFLAYSDLLYLGLGTSVIRYVAEHWTRNETPQLARIVSVVWTIYTMLGALALLLCVELGLWVPRWGDVGAAAGDATVMWTCALLGVRLMALFIASIYSGVLVGINRTDVALTVRLAFTIVRCAMIPLLLQFGDPLRTLAAIVALTSVGEALLLRIVMAVFTPKLRFHLVFPTRRELALLYGFGIKSFFLLLAVKIISYTDTTVIGLAAGPAAVALYVLPLQLVEYGRILVNGISTVLLPELAPGGARGTSGALRYTYLHSSRLAAMLAVFINVTIMFVGAPFLSLWVGEPFGRAAFPVLCCLGIAGIAQALTTQVSVPFYQATGKLGFPVMVLLLEAAANLALSIWLVGLWGITGVAVATLIPSFAITAAVLPAYLARVVGVSLPRWLSYAIAPAIVLLVVLVGAYSALAVLLTRTSYVTLAANVGIGAALSLLFAWRLIGVRAWWEGRSQEPAIAGAN
jgi:O-antigen/teichoic acid export membrane protein